MNKKDQRKSLEVLSTIKKNVENHPWTCYYPNCTKTAINSHLLQRNGILDVLAENGHLIQMKIKDLFKIEKEGLIEFKKMGINNVISYPLFCNTHDTSIFKVVEEKNVDYYDYKVQLLFSYQSLCAEIRKKQKNIELEISIERSNILHHILNRGFFSSNEISLIGNKQAIADLTFFKSEFENDLAILENRFTFYTLKFSLVKISVSAIFSYLRKGIEVFNSKPLSTVFINIFPSNDSLVVIIGYHKDFTDQWIINYVEKWRKTTSLNLSNQLSDLLVRVETWVVAESSYKKIPLRTWDRYTKLFLETMKNNSLYAEHFKEDFFSALIEN